MLKGRRNLAGPVAVICRPRWFPLIEPKGGIVVVTIVFCRSMYTMQALTQMVAIR